MDNPTILSQLKPISFCSTVYGNVLHYVISLNQTAILPNRLITNNICIAHELLFHLKSIMKSKNHHLSLKLDLSKVLEKMMFNLGFTSNFVSWVIGCISSVSYYLILNDKVVGYFIHERGLRQEADSVSPYLFLICAEGLPSLLSQVEERKLIQDLKTRKLEPPISHLLFGNDSLLFCKASVHKLNFKSHLTCESSLFAQLMKHKYYKNTSFFRWQKQVPMHLGLGEGFYKQGKFYLVVFVSNRTFLIGKICGSNH